MEKQIVSLLVDHKGQIERRGTQIYRQLTQISSRNEGMQELVNAMARLTNKAIVIQDKRLGVLYSSVQPQFVAYWDDVENFLRKLDNLPVDLQDRHRVSEVENPVLMQSLPTPGLARLVSPIITKDIGRGYLSIVGRDTELDDIDMLVAEHGAAACALEMAKAKAISDTEKRLRGSFLDRLLIGDVSAQEAVRQGERFDHDMQETHVAIVLSWQGDKAPSLRRLETIVNSVVQSQHVPALVWQRERESEVLVFLATDEKDPIITVFGWQNSSPPRSTASSPAPESRSGSGRQHERSAHGATAIGMPFRHSIWPRVCKPIRRCISAISASIS